MWEDWILRGAALLIAAGVIGRMAVIPVVRAARQAAKKLAEVNTLIEELHPQVEATAATVSRELRPNGGSSLKDETRRTTEEVATLREEVREMRVEVAEMTGEVALLAALLGEHQRAGHTHRWARDVGNPVPGQETE